MSEVKDKYQQQILFVDTENNTGKNETSNELSPPTQVSFENEDFVTEKDEFVEESISTEKIKKKRWLSKSILVLLLTLVGIEVVQFFRTGFSESPIIASIYAALFLSVTLLAGTTLIREYRGLRKFRRHQKLQEQVNAVLAQESKVSATTLCEQITKQLPSDVMPIEAETWLENSNKEYNDVELLQLYSRQILTSVDEKALAVVAKYSTESVVLIALSPIALLDMMLMFWRNLRMIDKISGLYGLKLGYWSRIKLIKQVFVNMLYAGASELITDFGSDLIGADLIGKLSGRMAQGVGAGMLTSRLGLRAIHLCRPIPFDQNAPKLKHVRKEIINQIKQLLQK